MNISAEIKAKLCQVLCKSILRVHLLHKVYKHRDKSLEFIDKLALSGKTNTSSLFAPQKAPAGRERISSPGTLPASQESIWGISNNQSRKFQLSRSRSHLPRPQRSNAGRNCSLWQLSDLLSSWAVPRAAPVPEPPLGSCPCPSRAAVTIPAAHQGYLIKLTFSSAQDQARLGRAGKLANCWWCLISFIIYSFISSSNFHLWGEAVQAGRIFLVFPRFPCILKGDFEHFSAPKWCHQVPSSYLMLPALGFPALVELAWILTVQ